MRDLNNMIPIPSRYKRDGTGRYSKYAFSIPSRPASERFGTGTGSEFPGFVPTPTIKLVIFLNDFKIINYLIATPNACEGRTTCVVNYFFLDHSLIDFDTSSV